MVGVTETTVRNWENE
ncbi:hypothetical protein [Nostoc sp. PA-18-2419]|nr:hypothetical protein [Nostoc sp. PA-18-2419]